MTQTSEDCTTWCALGTDDCLTRNVYVSVIILLCICQKVKHNFVDFSMTSGIVIKYYMDTEYCVFSPLNAHTLKCIFAVVTKYEIMLTSITSDGQYPRYVCNLYLDIFFFRVSSCIFCVFLPKDNIYI